MRPSRRSRVLWWAMYYLSHLRAATGRTERHRGTYAVGMDDLHRLADKVAAEVEHTRRAMEAGDVRLALASAKRVRRDSTILVRHLAALRDNATA